MTIQPPPGSQVKGTVAVIPLLPVSLVWAEGLTSRTASLRQLRMRQWFP